MLTVVFIIDKQLFAVTTPNKVTAQILRKFLPCCRVWKKSEQIK